MTKRGDSAEYALELPQVAKAMAACRDLEERIMIGCPTYLGLRVGELCHMNQAWIASEGTAFRLPAFQTCSCSECRRKGGVWKPKTKWSIRVLPIPGTIKKDLLRFLELQPKGLQLSRVTVNLRTKIILKRAGIKVRGLAKGTSFPHALRATCASLLAASGMEAAALSYYMGWASLRVADHYIKTVRARELAFKQAKEAFGG